MKKFTKKLLPPQLLSIYRGLRRKLNRTKKYPYCVRLTQFTSRGCQFEITGPIESVRVERLGEEEDFVRLFLAEVRPGDIVFDIGSCVGLYTLHTVLLGAKEVVAFEPDPAYRKRLIKNIALNRLETHIQVVSWAVSDRRGTEILYTDGVQGLSPSLRLVGKRGSVVVETDCIDNAIADNRIPKPALVKLDIEGAEILALRGMQQLLNSSYSPRCIFIELHPSFLSGFGSSSNDCIQILENAGYEQQYYALRDGQEHVIFRRKTSKCN